MKKFKIATYNVNSLNSRLHIVIPWLGQNKPDVFCMQETKVRDANFPRASFEDIGYHIDYCGESHYNGVATASLEKPQAVSYGFDNGRADGERMIRTVFSTVTVINSYVPQGRTIDSKQFAEKLEWYQRFKNLLEQKYSAEEPVIWCGDLNVAPENIDVHNPKRLLGHVDFNPHVWEAFASIKKWGLIDIFRKHHPGEPHQYTFYDYRFRGSVAKGLGWRVDHILATKQMAERSLDCYIDMKPRLAEKPSDHTIMAAEFSREEG